MEIADKTKERSTVILAVLTLVIIGLTLIMSTLQAFRHQREAEEQHLFLSTRAVLLSIESSVRRTPVREGGNRLSPQTSEFFQALEQDGDVQFVGIIDENGGKLLTSSVHGSADVELPGSMIREMMREGEWHGRLVLGGRGAYVYGKRLKPLRGMHMSLRAELGPPGYLVVGVDMDKHLSAYKGFRQNLILQSVYILAAAVITWGLGLSYLSRREQAKKVIVLENFQAKLLDNLPDGLITLGQDEVVRSANPAALAILKREAKDVLGKSVQELPLRLPCCSFEGIEQGKPVGWQHVSHERAHLEILALPLVSKEENSCLLIIRDRTLLRNLEKSLANAEKLAAVGTLAAGVAHEVRNPLSSLRGFAQYFVKKLAGKTPEEEYAKTMVREADRLNRVISDLLFLGRPKAIAPRQVDLETLAREIITLLRFDLEQKNVGIDLQLNARYIFADEDALKQALLNLLLNSLDALETQGLSQKNGDTAVQIPLFSGAYQTSPASGAEEDVPGNQIHNSPSLSLNVTPDTAPDDGPSLPQLPQGVRLRIVSGCSSGGTWVEVQDAGCGMTQALQKQAFEAFFTAKEQGTGLGLALVQRTMLDHGGSALIASEAGKGCALRLFFPASESVSLLGQSTSGYEGPNNGNEDEE